MNKIKLLIAIVVACISPISAQSTRLTVHEKIGWYNYFGTFKLSEKVGLHTEYQWRRENYISNWQQSLLRVGVNYQVNPRVLFRIGYAWVETFAYGELPINSLGKDFSEHRIFQMIQFSHKEGRLDLQHRFMLEQRFIGKYNSILSEKEDEFQLLNRMRYMFRFQIHLKGVEIVNCTPYLAVYDEVFIGFGKNVAANIFDQNRIGVLLGYKFSKKLKVEAGYLNQILQFGRLVNGKNVFQNNKGLIMNANFNF